MSPRKNTTFHFQLLIAAITLCAACFVLSGGQKSASARSISTNASRHGFTLVELSIVLVVIGLIVGGIIVGQSIISAAEVRAQITQIEKYNSAVNTFRSKFGGLPGDLVTTTAQQFGFVVTNCYGSQGGRDGNGLLDGQTSPYIYDQTMGEVGLFWVDLSSPLSGPLIDTGIPAGGVTIRCGGSVASVPITGVGNYFPSAKIGHGNFVYVFELSGANWYGVSAITGVVGVGINSVPTITAGQAYSMDTKVDDGLPTSGNVQAFYLNASQQVTTAAPNTTTSGGTSSSCYDTTTGTYSVTVNNGNGGNCALSFKFQ